MTIGAKQTTFLKLFCATKIEKEDPKIFLSACLMSDTDTPLADFFISVFLCGFKCGNWLISQCKCGCCSSEDTHAHGLPAIPPVLTVTSTQIQVQPEDPPPTYDIAVAASSAKIENGAPSNP